MKRLLALFLLLVVAKIPMELWVAANDEEKGAIFELIGETYCEKIEPKCAAAQITAINGGNGWVYFDVICLKEKPVA